MRVCIRTYLVLPNVVGGRANDQYTIDATRKKQRSLDLSFNKTYFEGIVSNPVSAGGVRDSVVEVKKKNYDTVNIS